jgi:hypothetical protein
MRASPIGDVAYHMKVISLCFSQRKPNQIPAQIDPYLTLNCARQPSIELGALLGEISCGRRIRLTMNVYFSQ